jgi:hypothetical protein
VKFQDTSLPGFVNHSVNKLPKIGFRFVHPTFIFVTSLALELPNTAGNETTQVSFTIRRDAEPSSSG